MEPQSPTSSKAIIWVVVLVILIGISTYFVIGKGGSKSNDATTQTNISTIANAVEVKDQLAGASVVLSNLSLDKGGFAVVHEATNGQPGAVIGSKYFERGERPGVIEVQKPTKSNLSYFVILYSDNGDKKLNLESDSPIADSTGKAIIRQFKALESVPETKG